jgi:hypothetical protein
MKKKFGNPNPSPSTRFKPGNPGGPGSSINKGKVQQLADDKLDEMLGKAHENVKKALNKGDVRVSMWLVDAVRKQRGLRVEEGLLDPLVDAIDSLDDVEYVSKQALLLAIKGTMNFEQLKAVQEALARHSVISGTVEIRRLREEIDEMRQQSSADMTITKDTLPTWGRLRDVTTSEDADEGSSP